MAESTFNAGKSQADYRAGLVASPETTSTLRSVSLQLEAKDACTFDLKNGNLLWQGAKIGNLLGD